MTSVFEVAALITGDRGEGESASLILQGTPNTSYGLQDASKPATAPGEKGSGAALDATRDPNLNGVPRYVYVLAGCGALNSCNLGFDIGVNTDAGILIQDAMALSDVKLELFMGSINFFAIIGALVSSRVVGMYGLRTSFVAAALGFIMGILLMILSHTYFTLMFGRIFVGLGVGFGMMIGPMYISEISPKWHRGSLVSWAEIGCNVGILIGFLVGFFFYQLPPNVAWRMMFATGLIMPVFMVILALWVMSESPRWLAQKQRNQEALNVLQRLRPPGFNVEKELEEIITDIEEERTVNASVGWSAIFYPSPAVRQMLIVGIGTAISQQLSGIDAIQYYLVFIMEEAGIKGRLHQTIFLTGLGILKLSCIFVGSSLFDRVGRRPLMILSLSGVICSLLLIASEFFASQERPVVVIMGLALYLAFFSLGLGPLGWVIPSEIFSTTIRAKAMSTTTFVNRASATIATSTMLSIANVLTWGGYFVALAVACTGILVFMVAFLPETKGKSLEEMASYFASLANKEPALLVRNASGEVSVSSWKDDTVIFEETSDSMQLTI